MRLTIAAAAAGLLAAAAAQPARAQDWTPPSREMPVMPTPDELAGAWKNAYGPWFRGVDGVSGVPIANVKATGDRGRSGRAGQVRFSGGVSPVAVWTDRNGDGKCDMLEIYRSGALAFQLIDADYDGNANVLRAYDASGALARETRL